MHLPHLQGARTRALSRFVSRFRINLHEMCKLCAVSWKQNANRVFRDRVWQSNEAPVLHPVPQSALIPLRLFNPSSGVHTVCGARRRWTTGDLTEIIAAIATLRTSDIARMIGVNPKALRSVLRRHGISLRALREKAKKPESGGTGLLLRRTSGAPSAIYGATALASLPDGACRWPLGDPAEPGFAFCGAAKLLRHSYCPEHFAQSRPGAESE